MFIQPMWSDEVERIGLQRCSPLGYRLRGIGELFGMLGLLALLLVFAVLVVRAFRGTFEPELWWLLFLPFGLVVVETALVAVGWSLARRRGFSYDYRSRTSTWIDHGEACTLTVADIPELRERGRR
jgi:hypothetical protein